MDFGLILTLFMIVLLWASLTHIRIDNLKHDVKVLEARFDRWIVK